MCVYDVMMTAISPGQGLEDKLFKLQRILQELGSVLVAYSGGVDSTLLLKCAVDTLGKDSVVAVTAISEITPAEDMDDAAMMAKDLGVRHVIIRSDELENVDFVANTPERCYVCKRGRYDRLVRLKEERGLNFVADGSNTDDAADYRPGEKALKEFGIRSPLREAGLYKAEIRELSRTMGLPTWDRPARACLASRFPYGTQITRDRLKMVEEAETALHCFGFAQLRVRYHGDVARIEVPESSLEEVLKYRAEIAGKVKQAGFIYVAVDLEGFRSGSLNEVLREAAR